MTYLVNGTISEEKLGTIIKKTTDLIKKAGGAIVPAIKEARAKLDENMPQAPEQTTPIMSADPNVSIFKRRLSYPVQHKRQGYFATVNFTVEKKSALADFEKELKLEEDIMRHIIIKKVPKPFREPFVKTEKEKVEKITGASIAEKEKPKEKVADKKSENSKLDELEKKLDKILNI